MEPKSDHKILGILVTGIFISLFAFYAFFPPLHVSLKGLTYFGVIVLGPALAYILFSRANKSKEDIGELVGFFFFYFLLIVVPVIHVLDGPSWPLHGPKQATSRDLDVH